jgi:hypothetical protein
LAQVLEQELEMVSVLEPETGLGLERALVPVLEQARSRRN